MKRAHLFERIELHGPGVGAELVIAPEIFRDEVVGVDVFARRDAGAGEADDLAVFPHGRAVGDFRDGDFVAGGNILRGSDDRGAGGEGGAGFDEAFGDGDIVGFAEADGKIVEVIFRHLGPRINGSPKEVKPRGAEQAQQKGVISE